jgi:hypothetical protein
VVKEDGDLGWAFDWFEEEIGWGGRIRTSTVLINSEVSYRLDHAPAADEVGSAARAIHGKVCFYDNTAASSRRLVPEKNLYPPSPV